MVLPLLPLELLTPIFLPTQGNLEKERQPLQSLVTKRIDEGGRYSIYVVNPFQNHISNNRLFRNRYSIRGDVTHISCIFHAHMRTACAYAPNILITLHLVCTYKYSSIISYYKLIVMQQSFFLVTRL